MNGKSWRRRISKISFRDPLVETRHAWLKVMTQRLSPGEREELADLRERLDRFGLEGLTNAELDRLEQLVTILQGDDPADGSVAQ